MYPRTKTPILSHWLVRLKRKQIIKIIKDKTGERRLAEYEAGQGREADNRNKLTAKNQRVPARVKHEYDVWGGKGGLGVDTYLRSVQLDKRKTMTSVRIFVDRYWTPVWLRRWLGFDSERKYCVWYHITKRSNSILNIVSKHMWVWKTDKTKNALNWANWTNQCTDKERNETNPCGCSVKMLSRLFEAQKYQMRRVQLRWSFQSNNKSPLKRRVAMPKTKGLHMTNKRKHNNATASFQYEHELG